MSRYEPANGLNRCALCGDLVKGDMVKHRRRHHNFWELLLWRWDQGGKTFVVFYAITMVLVLAWLVAAIRDRRAS